MHYLKPYLFVLGSAVLLLLLFACFRNFIFEKQIAEWSQKNEAVVKAFVVAIFVVCGAVLVPVFLKLFINLQVSIGNGDQPLVKLLRQHSMKLIYTVWIIFGVGLAIALPVMIKNSYSTNTSK
jgi:hypothetical protein